MKKYGLIGKSLSHSFSKKYFNSFFSENNIDAVYDEFEIPEKIYLFELKTKRKYSFLTINL